MAHMAHVVRQADGTVLGAGLLDPLQMGVGPHERLYETSDGWICLVVGSDEELDALGRVVGADLRADERFATAADREANEYALESTLSDVLATETTAHWVARAHDVGLPLVEALAEKNNVPFMRDPENRRTGRVAECEHPTHGLVRELAQFLRVSGSPIVPHRLAPGLGEHTRSILIEAGYSPAEVDALEAEGAAR
jgi:crotonobetainyl-CoA:carnitine CoA-transferase CaiB-like acyl-CoA transferase